MLLAVALIMPMISFAQADDTVKKYTVSSPGDKVTLTFYVESGRPTYEMTYKGKTVVKPSHLGLELAKDKHASVGLRETDLMDNFTVTDVTTSAISELSSSHAIKSTVAVPSTDVTSDIVSVSRILIL